MTSLLQKIPSCATALRLALALLCAVLATAARGNAATPSGESWLAVGANRASEFAIADFDGDRQPDLAVVQVGQRDSRNARYWISFELSSGSRQGFPITAPTGGLQIASRDVNGDGFLDVIVTTLWTSQPVAVLLNDGRGNFRLAGPSAFPEAFTTFREFWTVKTAGIAYAPALVHSRFPTWDPPEITRLSLPLHVTRVLDPRACGDLPSSSVAPFSGRAPPSFFLCL